MEDLGVHETYDIEDTASYILKHGYKRVALQFPDQLLNISVAVTRALMDELRRQSKLDDAVQLYVLADTTYGCCCGDEIAAAHVNAECIVHYGHACLSQMSKLPVWHVFGRASIDVDDCVQKLLDLVSTRRQHVLVLYDLEYVYSIPSIQKNCEAHPESFGKDVLSFANVPERAINPGTNIPILQQDMQELKVCGCEGQHMETSEPVEESTRISNFSYNIGGICWSLPRHCGMESVVVFWIGQEGPSLTNFMLTYNATAIVLYDPDRKVLLTDVTNQSKILRRRYYLVERAKDANIVGIVIGTLGVVGYRETVHKIKQFLKAAGKKSYTLAMGKPNPAKLANFPECDIFVFVACAQTALLDSKDFMAPVITPFEAMLAWKRGSQWTGSYSLDFTAVRGQQDPELEQHDHKEARFSFIKGAYVEDNFQKPTDHETISSRALILARETEQALQLQSRQKSSEIVRTIEARSGVEYFAARGYHGLENDGSEQPIQPHVMGRHGRASAYRDEMVDGAH